MKTEMWFNVIVCVALFGCNAPKQNAEAVKQEDAGMINATVIDLRELDGCGFILQLNDSVRLIPLNLADSLMVNNLELKISFKQINKPNICMAGKTVELTAVNFLK